MPKKSKMKFVKVLSVNHFYEISERYFVTTAFPAGTIARVVDTLGNISTIRTSDSVNVGDEIDIISETMKEGGYSQDIITITKVVKNYTQQKIINDFVTKNKTKSR